MGIHELSAETTKQHMQITGSRFKIFEIQIKNLKQKMLITDVNVTKPVILQIQVRYFKSYRKNV